MPGRPPLDVGTAGRIRFAPLPDGRVQARCLYRDADGHSRPITRIGDSQAAAERLLKSAVRDRRRLAGDALVKPDMKLAALGELWLERIDASNKAVNTKQQYRKVFAAYIKPTVGNLRVSEATVGRCDAALGAILEQSGKAVAKSARAVLSGMLGLAARHDALPANPVRDTEAIAGASVPKKGKAKALTVREAEDLADGLRTLDRAACGTKGGLDIADVVDMALATGARIGELLACRYGLNGDGKPLLDLDAGTWEVNATVVRVAGNCATCRHGLRKHPAKGRCKDCACARYERPEGAGLVIQERTKSEAGWRVLALPGYAVDMLRARERNPARFRGPHGVVFGSPHRRSLRDPSNCEGDLKEVLGLLGWEWPTFHTFRKTVATRMDEQGCTAREIADQLGHAKPSMTQDKYMGRDVVSARAAAILGRKVQ